MRCTMSLGCGAGGAGGAGNSQPRGLQQEDRVLQQRLSHHRTCGLIAKPRVLPRPLASRRAGSAHLGDRTATQAVHRLAEALVQGGRPAQALLGVDHDAQLAVPSAGGWRRRLLCMRLLRRKLQGLGLERDDGRRRGKGEGGASRGGAIAAAGACAAARHLHGRPSGVLHVWVAGCLLRGGGGGVATGRGRGCCQRWGHRRCQGRQRCLALGGCRGTW